MNIPTFKLLRNNSEIKTSSRGNFKINYTFHDEVNGGTDTSIEIIWSDGIMIPQSKTLLFKRNMETNLYIVLGRGLLITCENMIGDHDYTISQCIELCIDSFKESIREDNR
jgi:hypothetical protein